MRKVIGIGETILDIIFKDGVPTAAVPGGSSFNGIVSLARAGVETCFISETGYDKVGDTILNFMQENGISTNYINRFPDGKSPLSLAFLDNQNGASYLFYKDYPSQRLVTDFPPIEPDDIVLFGAYYSLNPALRPKIIDFLEYAQARKALIYYDPNFRSTHSAESAQLYTSILENMKYADLVRGAVHDFKNMFGLDDTTEIYQQKILPQCPNFICTHEEQSISLYTPWCQKEYPVPPISTVSTIGAGDNFNAGIIYALLKYEITKAHFYHLEEKLWNKIIRCGMSFAADVCQSYSNSISPAFVEKLHAGHF